MSVYVDQLRDWGWKYGKSCHMTADTNEELHEMALRIGMKRSWFQKSTSGPHYDLTAKKRSLAIKFGAIEISDRETVRMMNEWTKKAVARIKAAKTEKEKDAIRKELYR